MACLFVHKWDGCKCTKCGKLRNEGHNFQDGICSICEKTIDETIKDNLPKPQWSVHSNGKFKYFTANADSLAAASEILKQLSSIPPFTYYTVTTPDGKLGRDIVDFYTEAPLKTKGLQTKYRSCGKGSEAVEAVSLYPFPTGQDILKTQSTLAGQKLSGQYSKLILMMKCGHCGYESPVETDEGDLERECYFCGTKNKTNRAVVNVITAYGIVKL